MLVPLKQFICDECGTVIESPEDGYVEWESVREYGHTTVRGLYTPDRLRSIIEHYGEKTVIRQ